MEDNFFSLSLLVLRWFHILSGIIWIGLLYFFNFVNVPFQGALEKEYKSKVNPLLLPRALWWFRWGAMFTFIFGLLLLFVKYQVGSLWVDGEGAMNHRTMWILFGALLGTIMWFNVWFVIWPRQKQIITWVKEGQSPPEMAALAKTALFASRINAYLSGPMLFAMVAPNNYGTMSAGVFLTTLVVGFGTIWFLIRISSKVGTTV